MATTKQEFNEDNLHGYKRVHWNWECSSGGVVTSQTAAEFDGAIINFVTKPGSGSDAPTAAYDITITDEQGIDLLNGLGADRSATAQESKHAGDGLGVALNTKLTLNVANAGDVTKGQCRIDLA